MKILIVCSGNVNEFSLQLHHAYIFEQIESVKNDYNIEYDTYFVKGKGISGYLSNLPELKKKIKVYNPNIVHAHSGLSGLLAVLQRTTPVVITFHGSDLNMKAVRPLSKLAIKFARYSIFVSDKILKKSSLKRNYSVVPCGVDLDVFYPLDRQTARVKLKMDQEKKYILFSSGFDRPVKNPDLAFNALKKFRENYELIEMKNKSREEVNLLINASDVLLLTSFSEGSPQVIKEAMACNCPIVATDVGDISEVISDTKGCYITSFDPADIADKIQLALNYGKRTDGREKIRHFDSKIIAKKVFDIYIMLIG